MVDATPATKAAEKARTPTVVIADLKATLKEERKKMKDRSARADKAESEVIRLSNKNRELGSFILKQDKRIAHKDAEMELASAALRRGRIFLNDYRATARFHSGEHIDPCASWTPEQWTTRGRKLAELLSSAALTSVRMEPEQ